MKLKICLTMTVVLTVWSFAVLAGEKHIQFKVDLSQPQSHYYHVEMRCTGFQKDKLNFKLPAWTPGYYWIINFAKNVVKFRATTPRGKELKWDKVDKNNWEVTTGQAEEVIVSYDVFAHTASVADPFLDESHAYLSPAGVFMHIDTELAQPAEVELKIYDKWSKVSTGLDQVAGKAHTYRAADFDTLYDSPIYIGNQETMTFDVKGIPHTVAIANPKAFNPSNGEITTRGDRGNFSQMNPYYPVVRTSNSMEWGFILLPAGFPIKDGNNGTGNYYRIPGRFVVENRNVNPVFFDFKVFSAGTFTVTVQIPTVTRKP